jgi:hypothetical protein
MNRNRVLDHQFVLAILLTAGLVLAGCIPQDQSGSTSNPSAAVAAAGGDLVDFIVSLGRNILAAFVL